MRGAVRLVMLTSRVSQLVLLVMLTSSSTSSTSSLANTTEIACIDDSDCVKLGHKYSCFLYYCHNWVDPDPERPHCQADWQCKEEHKCYRHWNLREVDNGICLTNYQLSKCDGPSDCEDGDQCCGMYCCPSQYYKQWQEFACFSDMQCRSWKTGNYCCNNNLCCDDRKVEIQAFGIDEDLQTNEIPGVHYVSEEDIDGDESQVVTARAKFDPSVTSINEAMTVLSQEVTHSPNDMDKKMIIKDSITVNVSSYDLYHSDDVEISPVDEETTVDEGQLSLSTQQEESTLAGDDMTTIQQTTQDESGAGANDKTTSEEEDTSTISQQSTTEKNQGDETTLDLESDEEDDESQVSSSSSTLISTMMKTTLPPQTTTTSRAPVKRRPKNKFVVSRRFPNSATSSLVQHSSIIKSIGLLIIQLRMISNSFSDCYHLT